jgi:muramoyltetrapeptide carboxypeptidase
MKLQKGDKVMVIAPAGRIAEESLDPMVRCMERWGLQVSVGDHVYATYHQFAGTDEERGSDLQKAVNDPDVKAVICARGGYGCSRIIDNIDFSPLLKYPKTLVGYSDITVLHSRWNRLGLSTVHAVMSGKFPAGGHDNESTETLRKALFDEPLYYELPAHSLNREGEMTGVLTGGNLTLLTHLIGSVDEVNTADKILFLEDIGEHLYALDRLMTQLRRSGKLSKIKGLLIGYFTDMKDSRVPFGATVNEIILDHVREMDIPVCCNFPAGHEEPNLALLFGKPMRLSVTAQNVTVDFR